MCGNKPELCGLNSRGIDSGIESTLHEIKTIYRDFVLKTSQLPKKDEIIKYFNTDMFKLVNLEAEYIFSEINDEFTNKIFEDMKVIFNSVNGSIMILGIISIICNIFIVFYLIFGFLSMLRSYLKTILYSCNKFNKALFDEWNYQLY